MPGSSFYARSFLLLYVSLSAYAQNTSSWVQNDILPTGVEPRQLTKDAASTLAGNEGLLSPSNYSIAAELVSVLALQDFRTNQTTFQSQVSGLIQNLNKIVYQPSIDNRARLVIALAGIYAHSAYHEKATGAFNMSIDLWNQVYSSSNLSSNPSRFSTCINSSTRGVVYKDEKQDSIQSADAGMFIALSGYLDESDDTDNTTYSEAASSAADFLQTRLMTEDHFITSNLNYDCTLAGQSLAGSTGAVIEGLSVLASQTPDWDDLLNAIIRSAILNGTWNNGTTGVLEDNGGQGADDHLYPEILLRGLSEASYRNKIDPNMTSLVKDYVTVQFNAHIPTLEQLANNDTGLNKLDILPALYASEAVAFYTPSDNSTPSNSVPSPNSSSSPTSPSISSASSTSRVGVIVGSVIGSLVFLTLVALATFYLLRRHRHRKLMPSTYASFDASRMVSTPIMRARDDEHDEHALMRKKPSSPPPPRRAEAVVESYSSGNLLIDRSRSPSLSDEGPVGQTTSAEAAHDDGGTFAV